MSQYFCNTLVVYFSSSQSLFLSEGFFLTNLTDKLKAEFFNISISISIARWINCLGGREERIKEKGIRIIES